MNNQVELRFVCDTTQQTNNTKGRYGPARTTIKNTDTGERTMFGGLGEVSINRAGLRAFCFVLLMVLKKYPNPKNVSIYIRDYHQVPIKWATTDGKIKTKGDIEEIKDDIKIFRELKNQFRDVTFLWSEKEKIKELMK